MDDFHQFKNFFVNTRFRGSPDSRNGAKTIHEKLGVDTTLRGNQLRRELRTQIAEGKVTPFEEVWTTKPAPPAPVKRDRNGKVIRKRQRTPAGARTAKLLGEAEATDLTQYEDPRQPLMDWLRHDRKQLFARSIVNRIWSCYFNVGIVEPPDDLSLANPPGNAALLDHLATGFVSSGYDLKWVHREITRSDTYQRTWVPNDTNLRDERNFSHSIPRRMPAEVAMDALVAATSSDDAFAELQTSITGRSIAQVSAGSRYNENPRNYALSVFGRSIRESNCDCDRSQEPSLLQTVFLQNDSHIYDLMDRGKGGWINQVASELGMRQTGVAATGRTRSSTSRLVAGFQAQIKRARAALKQAQESDNSRAAEQNRRRIAGLQKRLADLGAGQRSGSAALTQKADPEKLQQVVRETYLRTLSREPVDTEIQKALAYVQASEDQLQGLRDVLWALLNTKEFIVNH